MRRAFYTGYVITAFIGIYLSVAISWGILVFGLCGMACAYFYTAPPIRYGYHGLGEISQMINFSFTIGMGSYFVQTQELSWEAFWTLLPLGFMMFSMITINEIPDRKEDAQHGKNNLVVMLGVKKALWLYGGGMIIAYAIIAVTPLLGITTPWIYLALITIPLFVQSLRILRHHYRDPLRLSPANLLTIRIHSLTGILLITAHIVSGAQAGCPLSAAFVAVLLLFLLYVPLLGTLVLKKRTPL
jgi:1,4-dihydroxy-2-naphthoate octaprenyltransferase